MGAGSAPIYVIIFVLGMVVGVLLRPPPSFCFVGLQV
jgi:hypothetical protein